MDIYVLHDGKEIGPLSPEKTRQLMQQGSVLADDLAWSPGMGKWEPLAGFLPPPGEAPAAPAPDPFASATLETSTAKQRALLAFLHLGFTRATSRQEAALLISDALENPAYAVRLGQWPTERLKLHGDLFAAELQARRENRAHHYQMLAQSEGAALLSGVTKAHALSVITHLDLESPNWEADEASAARAHFFPAIAEKFPQLVRPEAPGRLDLPRGQKSTTEIPAPPARKTPSKERGHGFPLAATVRGLFFGALIVAIGWFVMNVLQGGKSPATTTSTVAVESTPPPVPTPPPTAEAVPTPESAPSTPAPMVENSVPTVPVTPASAPTEPTPIPAAPPAAPAAIQLTKPFEAKLTYGSMTLPAGTSLKFISQEGALLKVQYLNNILLVPASSTNHSAVPAAAPGL